MCILAERVRGTKSVLAITWHVIPLGAIGDATRERLIEIPFTFRLPCPHDGVVLCINPRQVPEESIIRRLAVEATRGMRGRVIEGIAGHHSAAVQVPREDKPGESKRASFKENTYILL